LPNDCSEEVLVRSLSTSRIFRMVNLRFAIDSLLKHPKAQENATAQRMTLPQTPAPHGHPITDSTPPGESDYFALEPLIGLPWNG
jgi:hypothetical protein